MEIKKYGSNFLGELFMTDTGCQMILSKEEGLLHISISHPHRYPSWDEIKEVRYALLPHDKTIAMILPPPTEYVNIHQNCFHLHELNQNEFHPTILRKDD